MSGNRPLMIVAGAGPGLGHALLQRFQSGSFKTVGLSRSLPDTDHELDIQKVDLTNNQEVTKTVQELSQRYGPPKVVIHNPAELIIRSFAETTLEDFEASWRSMTLSAVILGQAVLMPMVRGGGGAFLVSGATASLRGGARFSAFASAKFALRGLTQSLAREFQPAGIHVAHINLDGIIDTARSRAMHSLDPAKMMKPEDIAETYWQVAHQPSSTWSHEIDLRPKSESF